MDDNAAEISATSHFARRLASGTQLTLLLRLYGFAGALFAVGALGYLVYSRLRITLSQNEQLAVVAAISGATLSILSFAMMSYRNAVAERDRKRYDEFKTVGQFLQAWEALEEVSRAAAFGETSDAESKTLRETFSLLRKSGKITSLDTIALDELLRIRNSLVHRSRDFPVDDLKAALDKLVGYITRLS